MLWIQWKDIYWQATILVDFIHILLGFIRGSAHSLNAYRFESIMKWRKRNEDEKNTSQSTERLFHNRFERLLFFLITRKTYQTSWVCILNQNHSTGWVLSTLYNIYIDKSLLFLFDWPVGRVMKENKQIRNSQAARVNRLIRSRSERHNARKYLSNRMIKKNSWGKNDSSLETLFCFPCWQGNSNFFHQIKMFASNF